jgi:tetratricopeptide (TPR) repeat protein
MSFSGSELAVRVAAAGLGAAVAGPLGGAMGGLVAGVLTGPAAELVKNMAAKFGESAAEKMFDSGGDAIADELRQPDSDLEAVYREALRRGLDAVHVRAAGDFEDWFANWSVCLKSSVPLQLPNLDSSQLVAAKLDGLLFTALRGLDAQGAAIRGGRTTLFPAERDLPDLLWTGIVQSLPKEVANNFSLLIVSEQFAPAWKQAQIRFEEFVAGRLVKIEASVAQGNEKLDELVSGQRLTNEYLAGVYRMQLQQAERDERVSHAEAKALEAWNEAARWKQKYRELARDQPDQQSLLATGDLEGAAKSKQEEIERQEVQQAKSYFELGKIQELRFDWAGALDAYRRSWKIGKGITYGYAYGLFAAKQKHYDEAEMVFETISKAPETSTDKAAALIELGKLYQETGRSDAAEAQFLRAKKIYDEIIPVGTNKSKAYIAGVKASLGSLYERQLQRVPEAEAAIREALDAFRQLAVNEPKTYLPRVAGMEHNLANLFRHQDRWQEAATAYEESVATFRQLAKSDPAENTPNLALALNSLSVFYRLIGRTGNAEEASRESIELYEKLASTNPEAYDDDVATSVNNLAILFSTTGRPDEAVPAYQRAVDIRIRLAQAYPAAYEPLLAMTLNDIAVHYQRVGMFEEAVELCVAAENILRPLWTANHETHGNQIAKVLGLKSDLWRMTDRPAEEACQFIQEALTMAYEPGLRKLIESDIERYCPKFAGVDLGSRIVHPEKQ